MLEEEGGCDSFPLVPLDVKRACVIGATGALYCSGTDRCYPTPRQTERSLRFFGHRCDYSFTGNVQRHPVFASYEHLRKAAIFLHKPGDDSSFLGMIIDVQERPSQEIV